MATTKSSNSSAEALSMSIALLKLHAVIARHETYKIMARITELERKKAGEKDLLLLFAKTVGLHIHPDEFLGELKEASLRFLDIKLDNETDSEQWAHIGKTAMLLQMAEKGEAAWKRGGKHNKAGKDKDISDRLPFRRATVLLAFRAVKHFEKSTNEAIFQLFWTDQHTLSAKAALAKKAVTDWAKIPPISVTDNVEKAKQLARGTNQYMDDAHLFLNRFRD